MTAHLLFALLLAVAPEQAPAARARAARVVHDTIRLVVQPPPTVNVEAPSQLPAFVLGIAGLILLGFQLLIMGRQTGIMAKQTALGEQQAAWRRDEAIATFYRIAFDLVDELRKANKMTGTRIPANYDTHPRQMLREAARLFAPLGPTFVFAATETVVALERYFVAVEEYDAMLDGRDGAELWQTVQTCRQQVGIHLDSTNLRIPDALRWKYSGGKEYDFRYLCSMPPGLGKAIGGPSEEGESPKDEET